VSPKCIGEEEDRLVAFRLRREGYHYQAIAEKMGCAVSTAHKRVDKAYKAARKLRVKETSLAMDIDLARLDSYLVCLNPNIKKGKTTAIKEAREIVKLRGIILGYSAAAELNVNLGDGQAKGRILEAIGRKAAAEAVKPTALDNIVSSEN